MLGRLGRHFMGIIEAGDDGHDSEEKSVGYSKNVMSLREDLIETKVPLGSAMQP